MRSASYFLLLSYKKSLSCFTFPGGCSKIANLDEFIDRLNKMQPEDFRGQMPLFYSHVNTYGRLLLNMLGRIIIE